MPSGRSMPRQRPRSTGPGWLNLLPRSPSYQVDLGAGLLLKAWTEHQLGRESDALASADQALKIFDRLIEDEPENLDYQVKKGFVLNHKGVDPR